MKAYRRWSGRYFAFGGLLAVAALAYIVTLLTGGPSFYQRIALAEERWATNGFARYRLVIKDENSRCKQDVLVEGEQVVKRISNDCLVPPRTVSSLFRLLKGSPPSRYPCVEYRCACDTVMSVKIDFDSDRGYPRSIRYTWSAQPSWHHNDYWRYIFTNGTLPVCRGNTFSRVLSIVSLTPLNDTK